MISKIILNYDIKYSIKYSIKYNMAELNVVIKRQRKGTNKAGAGTSTSAADTSEADTSAEGAGKAGAGKAGSRTAVTLQTYFNLTDNNLEIGIDEAGRGPMFGRVYTAAVVLPKDDSFNHSLMKDSKKFHSVKKIKEVAEYIKKNALYLHVAYADEQTIDEINILNATHKAMHEAVKAVVDKAIYKEPVSFHLLVDGNNFKPFRIVNPDMSLEQIRHTCIEGGDNIYTAIAAASILAKVERDTYIEELCKK